MVSAQSRANPVSGYPSLRIAPEPRGKPIAGLLVPPEATGIHLPGVAIAKSGTLFGLCAFGFLHNTFWVNGSRRSDKKSREAGDYLACNDKQANDRDSYHAQPFPAQCISHANRLSGFGPSPIGLWY